MTPEEALFEILKDVRDWVKRGKPVEPDAALGRAPTSPAPKKPPEPAPPPEKPRKKAKKNPPSL